MSPATLALIVGFILGVAFAIIALFVIAEEKASPHE